MWGNVLLLAIEHVRPSRHQQVFQVSRIQGERSLETLERPITSMARSVIFVVNSVVRWRRITCLALPQLAVLEKKVDDNQEDLIYFLLFLRLFPVTPNWFLNMASPIVGVPIHLFFFSVFVGRFSDHIVVS